MKKNTFHVPKARTPAADDFLSDTFGSARFMESFEADTLDLTLEGKGAEILPVHRLFRVLNKQTSHNNVQRSLCEINIADCRLFMLSDFHINLNFSRRKELKNH